MGEPVGGSGGALGELEDLKNTHFLGLAELWEALGELWEVPYTKTPDQPPQRTLCYRMCVP